MSDMDLLLTRLGRLAIVLDELMPRCAELVRSAVALLKKQQHEIWELQEQVEYLTDKQKEQDAVEPKPIGNNRFACGACGNSLWVYHQRFCASCGRSVKWE